MFFDAFFSFPVSCFLVSKIFFLYFLRPKYSSNGDICFLLFTHQDLATLLYVRIRTEALISSAKLTSAPRAVKMNLISRYLYMC